jgi:threonine aldolase
MLGGGMRQAGVIAAAAHYALEHNVARLAEDHQNAADLSAGLARIDALTVTTPQTNIFYVEIPEAACAPLRDALARQGIRASIAPHTRLVTHLDVTSADVRTTIAAFESFFRDWKAQ